MVKFLIKVIVAMSKLTDQTEESEALKVGDFVCPQYYSTTYAKEAKSPAFVYQVTEIGESGKTTVVRVSNPNAKIVASKNFFISLEGGRTDV